MSIDYFPRLASKPPGRIYTRYSPSYQGYQSKITLERVDDDAPGYVGYAGRTKDYSSYHPYFFRESTNDLSYPPFGYVSSFKIPVRTAQTEVLPAARVSDLKAIGTNRAEAKITTTAAIAVKPFRSQRYRILGYLISILAILTFVFEIADVIVATLSGSSYCNTAYGFLTIPWFFAWVAPGIWASIPIFVTGILAIYVMDNYGRVFKALAIICSVCAFFFAPAIIAVSAAEEAMFIQDCPTVWGANSTTQLPGPLKAKFVFPIILIILGILEMLLLLYLTIVLCQAYEGLSSEVILTETKGPQTMSGSGNPVTVVTPTLPLPLPAPAPAQPAIPDVISIVVPRPPQTLLPPRVTGVGVPARVVYMEAHNHGYAYSNAPGYFTTLPPTKATAGYLPTTTDAGYKWF